MVTSAAELLRLDMTVPPTPPTGIHRLGPFAHDASGNATPDPAGFPNGRRLTDDVVDIASRAVAGAFAGLSYQIGDGVNSLLGHLVR